AECVADGADVGRAAEQGSETVLVGGVQDCAPLGPAGDVSGQRRGVDGDVGEAGGDDQHAVGRRPGEAVAGGLDGDRRAVGVGVAHRRGDVTDVGGDDDHGRGVGEADVPGGARLDEAVLIGGEDGAGDLV